MCNYRAYRLVNADPTVDDWVFATTRNRVQYLLVVMGEYKFSGVDPIRVISFLARCKENFDNANMTEAMALIALPHLLSPPAKEAYESQRGLHRKSQGIANWAAAVNWLLRTYATNLEIERALTTLRELHQKPGELETEYATRLSTALGRCGDVHSPYDRTTLFIEGLTPAIKPLVLQAREDRPRSSFKDTVAHARSHGDAFRAQQAAGRRVDFLKPRSVKPVVAALDSVPSSTTDPSARFQSARGGENYFATEGDNVGGVPSLPTEESSFNDGDSLFYDDRRRPDRPAREPTEGSRGIPPGRTSRKFQNDLLGSPSPQIICFACYTVGDHIAPDCAMNVKDVSLVPHRYEKLTTAQKSRVPTDAYLRAVALLSVVQYRALQGGWKEKKLSGMTSCPDWGGTRVNNCTVVIFNYLILFS